MRLHKTIWAVIASIVLTVGVSNAQVKQKISEEQLTELLGRIATSTDAFAKSADTAMDKGGYNGSARENDLNDVLKRFRGATAALSSDHSGPNAKSDFEKVLHYGVAIENFLKKYPLDGVQDNWTALRGELGELATGFNITWEEGHAIGAPVGAVDVKNLCQHIEDVADHFKEGGADAVCGSGRPGSSHGRRNPVGRGAVHGASVRRRWLSSLVGRRGTRCASHAAGDCHRTWHHGA
jgi:hypothetical protein